MPEWLQNVLTLVVVCTVLYAFFSEQLARLGLRSLLVGMVRGFRILAEFAVSGLAWFGYRVLLGREVPRRDEGADSGTDDSVNLPAAPLLESAPLPAPQPAIPIASTPVAMPTTPDNGPLTVVTPDNGAAPDLVNYGGFDAVDHAVARAVARLIVDSERAPYKSGKISEARAIESVWACTRSSRPGTIYAEARELLQAELAKLRGPGAGVEYVGDMIRRIENEVKNETA